MYVQDMIDRIVGRLQAANLPVRVEAFPDDPGKYKLIHPKGAALVAYGGSRYGNSEGLGRIVQGRSAQFDITLLLRKLHGKDSAVAILEAIRVALTGLRMTNQTDPFGAEKGPKLRPVSDRFTGHGDGVWRYLATFEALVPAVEVLPEAQPGEISKITFEDPDQNAISTHTPEEASE